jgi:DNA polymerase elongation subunit (family B)
MQGFNGLKTLEAFLGMSIDETEVDFNLDRKLTNEEIQSTINYCTSDVLATIEVFEKSRHEFDSLIGLVEMYDLPLESIGKTKAQLSATILGAKRPERDRDDEWDIKLPDNLVIKKYTDVVEWFMSDEIKKPNAKYEREVYGVKHVFGLGGIHGATSKSEYDGIIALWDVASLYPSCIIEYDLMSRNVQDRNKYKEIKETRLKLKRDKDPRQGSLKIVLNATYGILKDKHSQMYDPLMANQVCIYNQLFLLMLIEMIEEKCDDKAQLIQSNTDGIYFQFNDYETLEIAKSCVDEWEKITRYEMELDMAKKVIQRDVNNYVLQMQNGKVKAKGAVVKELKPLDYDLPIVNKAMKEYLINGTPFEEYIANENRLIEYQKIYKLGSNYKCALHNGQEYTHKVYRCFASKDVADTPIMKLKKDKDKADKYAGTPDHVFIDNGNIQDKLVPEKLDKEWYINRCVSEYKKFTGKDYKRQE